MSNGEVKRFSLVTDIVGGDEWTGLRRHAEGYYMSYADHERVVAELKAEIERLELVAMAAAESIKEKYRIMDTQKRVIEKLKGMVSHYETCATVDRYDDEKVPCDCGLEKELAAIEKGEA